MKKYTLFFVCSLLMIFSFCGCSGNTTQKDRQILIDGSDCRFFDMSFTVEDGWKISTLNSTQLQIENDVGTIKVTKHNKSMNSVISDFDKRKSKSIIEGTQSTGYVDSKLYQYSAKIASYYELGSSSLQTRQKCNCVCLFPRDNKTYSFDYTFYYDSEAQNDTVSNTFFQKFLKTVRFK